MFCIKCGKKLPDDSIFCEFCGTKVEKLEETVEVETITEKVKDDIKEETKEEVVKEEQDNKEEQEVKEETTEEESLDDKEDKKKAKKEKKKEKQNKKGFDFDELDIAVADLKPDDFDDLVPKKSIKSIIITIIVIGGLSAFIYWFFNSGKAKEILGEKKVDYQAIINEYAEAIEDVTSEYLIDHELVNDFSDIKDNIKYTKHKVSCDYVYINIDGTVVLSECTVDGKRVKEEYGKKYSIQSKNDSEKCYINHEEEENKLEFNVDGEVVSVYECEHHKCGLYKSNNVEYNSCMDQIALIEDGSNVILYNYKEAQNLLDPFEEAYAVMLNNKYQGFVVKDKNSGKYGYINTRGVVSIDYVYDSLGLVVDNNLYYKSVSADTDRIVAKKDGKYGVVSLSKNDLIIPFEYDMVYLSDSNYLVKKDGKYTLVNSSIANQLSKSYDMIFAFDDVFIVSENKKLIITDFKGNKLVEDEIELYIDYKDTGTNGIFGYSAVKNKNIINIEVNKSEEDKNDVVKYTYSISDKKLIKK